MSGDLKPVFCAFNAEGDYLRAKKFGSGHIHDTYKIETVGSHSHNYILQRINRVVFNDVETLQRNIEVVTSHIRSKLSVIPGSDPVRQCLSMIPTRSGERWHADQNGNFWRLFIYIENHRSYDIVDSPQKAYEGGRAIGRFVNMLSDLPADSIAETIPYFHNVEKRLDNFLKSISDDRVQRAALAKDLTAEILNRAGEMKVIVRLGEEGKIPIRITHNDTKFNNVLLDENDKALCVIDLDTVMPGYVHYDYGDAIRTAASTAAEDETNLSLVSISLPLFESWTAGFLGETKQILTSEEKKWLAFAPRLITYTQALRFLTDYIDGDIYYKVRHPGHNLERATAQFSLLKNMERYSAEMEDIVRHLC
jgi:hypothetical protein